MYVGMSKPQKYANKVRIVLTQKVNVGPKIKQTTSIQLYISTYTAIKQKTKTCTYVGLYGSGLFNFESYDPLC